MQTLESLREKIDSAQALQSIVKTMKSMAAVNIQQYEEAVISLAEYNRSIERGFQILLEGRQTEIAITLPKTTSRLGAVIFGSDQGMVGQFNPRVVEFALDEMNGMQVGPQDRTILAVGLRIMARLEQAGQAVDDHISVPNSIAGITARVQEALIHIERWRTQREIDRIVLFHNSPEKGAAYQPHVVHLLPIDPDWFQGLREREWPSRGIPTFRMDWKDLFSTLVRQYFFAALYRAFAESLASENSSRLKSMQAAERNIRERLDELNRQYHRRRQSSITEELLDVVAGFTVLTDKEHAISRAQE